MGEQASKIGAKLESFNSKFLSHLGWIELARDMEIKCTRSVHEKRTHGIDMLCKFKNPYLSSMQGVVVECKNRQMQSITQASMQGWITELINEIECAQSAPELSAVDLTDASLNTGLLVIHANDMFDKKKFYEYLQKVSVPNRRNPINIFVAANDKIDMWTSLFNKIDTKYKNGFEFIYPSIRESSKTFQNVLTINGMYSKYLFAKNVEMISKQKDGVSYTEPRTRHLMFFLDEINPDNFKYAWSMFKFYQLQEGDKYDFVFYPQKAGDVEFVNTNFISTLKSGATDDAQRYEINKIHIDFLDNRLLSPVETGGNL